MFKPLCLRAALISGEFNLHIFLFLFLVLGGGGDDDRYLHICALRLRGTLTEHKKVKSDLLLLHYYEIQVEPPLVLEEEKKDKVSNKNCYYIKKWFFRSDALRTPTN